MEKNKRISARLAVIAASLSVTAFIIYSWKTIRGETHPNLTSWFIWTFLTILNSATYKKVTADWVKSIVPIVNAIFTIVILIFTWRSGSFEKVIWVDMVCLIFGMIAVFAWLTEKSATLAQISLQIAIIIGFIPTFRAMVHSHASESWIPWFLWTCAFVAQYFAVKATWKGKDIEFLYPVSMLFCHFWVFVLALIF